MADMAVNGASWAALAARDDLAAYGASNALLLFTAQLRLKLDDVDTFAADALTDGGNDKKCDLVAVMRDAGVIVLAQGYVAQDQSGKQSAPANKASDLNTAVSWLLAGELDELPLTLRSAAEEARDALRSGDIVDFQLWYVHNLPESTNVQIELQQAAQTASALLARDFSGVQVNVSFNEIGFSQLDDDYRKTQAPILVSDNIEFPINGGFETAGNSWTAYNTAVPAAALRDLWKRYSANLMSPNIRDYLGVRKSERNINYGIKQSARNNPSDFVIYNNGVTAMVHSFKVAPDQKHLTVSGIGIVNGGQTTGAIGTLSDAEAGDLDRALVQIRFVASKDTGIIENVVKFNNTQNKVETTDFRSRDPVQDRLRQEFASIPDAQYRGGRRGGTADAIKRDRSLLPDGSVAQALAAFHGYPNLAYNELREIWENDPIYARFFNDKLHASHVVFCHSLLKAIETAKLKIMQIPDGDRTAAQKGHADFFRSRGSAHLLTSAIGYAIETILGHAVPDKFALRFRRNVSPSDALLAWFPVVQAGLAFSPQLKEATNLGLKAQDRVSDAWQLFLSMIESTRTANAAIYDVFAQGVASDQATTASR